MMTEARIEDNWSRNAALMALIANCNRDSTKQRPFRPDDFYPFRKRSNPKHRPLKTVPITALRDVFIRHRWPKMQKEHKPCEPQK